MNIGDFARDRGPNNGRYYGTPIIADINGGGTPHVARLMMGDASTLANCTFLEYMPASAWADNGITAKCYQGKATIGQTVYLYAYTEAGPPTVPVATATIVAPPAPFNFFISPTGLSTNAGTLAAPWDLNSINTKQATYAGKRVGLIAGTYSFVSLGINQNTGDFGKCALQIACGTPTAQTYIASCDSSGNYSLGAAILDAGSTLANNPAISAAIGTYGSAGPNGSQGYITLDGIELKNAIGAGIQMAFVTGVSAPSTRYKGIIVQNCYVHSITMPSGGSAGANLAGIVCYACDGAQVLNNYITDIQDLVSNAPDQDPFRSFGIKFWTSINCTARYNTVYAGVTSQSPCGGIDYKNSFNWSNEIAYNYVNLSNAASIIDGSVIISASGGNSSFISSLHHNIVIGDPISESSDLGTDPTNDSFQIYNNTFVGDPNWTVVGMERFTGASLLTHYNNLYHRTSTTGNTQRGDFNCNASSLSLTDYNWFPPTPALGLTANGSTAHPPSVLTSISAWAAAITSPAIGKDAHSLTAASTFANAGGSLLLASDYQLPGTYGNGGTSIGANAGSSNGQTSGTAVNIGAWDGVVTQIGCSWKHP
jgi:hypothetical protein